MRRGQKATCYCGREIWWNGKYWEHTEGSYRHIAKPADKKAVSVSGIDLLRKVYHQTAGDHLLESIHDNEMVQVYLSAGLLRDIAGVCNPPLVASDQTEVAE